MNGRDGTLCMEAPDGVIFDTDQLALTLLIVFDMESKSVVGRVGSHCLILVAQDMGSLFCMAKGKIRRG